VNNEGKLIQFEMHCMINVAGHKIPNYKQNKDRVSGYSISKTFCMKLQNKYKQATEMMNFERSLLSCKSL